MVGVGLFVFPLAVAADSDLRSWTVPFLQDAPRLAPAALALIWVGRLVTSLAAWQLHSCARRGDRSLQRTGLFRYSRNPILVGLYLFYAGNCLWLPSVMTCGGFGLYAWSMHRRVLMEEGFLLAKFKAEYHAYLERVPRYLGGLRRMSDRR